VLISRQFSVIAETVNEVRFALDSVFIGPSERQTLLLQFDFGNGRRPAMFLETILVEMERFCEQGPRLLRDDGRITVHNNNRPDITALRDIVDLAHEPSNVKNLPDGYRTARVQNALDDLTDQLTSLLTLVQQVGQDVPPPEFVPALGISSVVPNPI